MFNVKEISKIIKTEAIKRLEEGLHPNLTNAIYEVYLEIGKEVIYLMVEANKNERLTSS